VTKVTVQARQARNDVPEFGAPPDAAKPKHLRTITQTHISPPWNGPPRRVVLLSARYRSRPVKRVRLDSLLSQRGVYPSRSRAAASVLAGDVMLLPERRRAEKPGQLVPEDIEIEVAAARQFASRGGIKLANALDSFGLSVQRRRALDIGASTGGFTDCLLQRGAAHVAAVDVAYGELDWRLRSDPRVTVLERRNARALRVEELPYRPDLIVIDVSFISLTKVLPAVLGCSAATFDCLAMVKPQFEVGREHVGKGGVVRDPALRRSALMAVGEAARGLGASVLGYASSGLPGPKGNRESFVWLAEPGRARAVVDLERAAREAEPA
jgi:23S rRNA (cytidine1920-2'-O)/16S rRNA (cytidine1409-2'-O)-methyltransferase